MRRTVVLTALVALALPVQAARADDDPRPFRRGTLLPSVALGGSFSRNYGGSLLVGAGASYFVVGGLAVGLHVRNLSTFYSQRYKEYVGPTIFSQIPTNEFSLTPSLLWVLYRGERVAPYMSLGVGPVFLNKKRGVLGQWSIGPGIMIRAGGSMWIDLSIGFSMRFTKDRCEKAYTFVDPVLGTYQADYACSFTWGFRGGIVFGIGGRRSQPSAQPAPPPRSAPYSSPGYAPPASPPPAAPEPVPSASPPPSAAPPLEAPPEPPLEAPPEAPVPDDATAPVTAPTPASPPADAPDETGPVPPPSESLVVPPPA